LVCQLETYFGLVQDCFGLVQGCFASVRFKGASAVQGCFSLVRFGSRFLQFGSVQGCFSSSRLLQFGLIQFKIPSVWFKVALVVQGAFVGAWSCKWFKVASSVCFKVICFGSRILRFSSRLLLWFKVMSIGGWFSSFGFIWFKVASLQILMLVRFKADNHFSFGWELYFGASVTSEGSLEFYRCFYEYGFSNLLQLGDCKSTAFHRVWPPQEVIHETTPITSREPMRG
jgi:hypothetical protein